MTSSLPVPAKHHIYALINDPLDTFLNSCFLFLGGMQDYNYLYVGCMELTLEISCCKYPMAAELQSFWHANKEPLLAYLQQVHIGACIPTL